MPRLIAPVVQALVAAIRRYTVFLWNATRPDPGYVPYFSMTRAERWFYFHSLEPLLRPIPWPIWRTPAASVATLRLFFERDTDELARQLLLALGQRTDRLARWRFRWQHWYLEELDRFLLIQGHKLSPAWARRQFRVVGALPSSGAILIGPHQACRRLGALALVNMVETFGGITGRPTRAEDFDRLDATLRHVFARRHLLAERYYNGGQFSTQGFAARSALRLLRGGGYLNSVIDSNNWLEPRGAIFGRWLTVFGPGTIWLAQQAQRPIVPYMVVPNGRSLQLWIGQPVEPNREAINAAIEDCIRRSPASWELTVAMSWVKAPRVVSEEEETSE